MTAPGRISEKFADLRNRNQAALMPFITAGDPDLETTADLLLDFQNRGVALVELGIPFSDPVADGPVIQSSYTRSLQKGFHVSDLFDWMRLLRSDLHIPVVTMLSYSILFRFGPERFVQEAKSAGFDGAIVPDLPAEEAETFITPARQNDFDTVFLVAPTTTQERRREILKASTGFVYYISVTGITGAREKLPNDVVENIDQLKSLTRLPVCVGFGVSNPRQAEMLAHHADGVIVGSAIVRMLEKGENVPRSELVKKIGKFVGDLVQGAVRAGQKSA